MRFAQPLWILVGIVFCLGIFFLLRLLQARRSATLEQFVSPELRGRLTRNVSQRRRTVKKILFLLAIFSCFLALARPQYGFKWVEVKRKGIDILFALDTSKSMLAEDIKPNRLERAKFAILDFVSQLEGDRAGVLPFAGSAFLMCPLTIDYNAFEQSLDAIDTAIIPKGGTDIAAALEEAGSILNHAANHKLLILITDGENLQGDTLKAAEKAAEQGMTIFTVGVGTKAGELIPTSINGKAGFIKDGSGKFVTSRLDETMLARIAETGSGLYVPLGSKGEGLETIYQTKLALIPKEELAERRHKVPLERFQWAVAAALVFLMTEFMLGSRKSGPLRLPFAGKINERRKRKSVVQTVLLLCLFLQLGTNYSWASDGEKAYETGDYITASEIYASALEKNPNNYRLHYNYGSAAYKNNLFDDAIASYTTALKSSDLQLQERAYYNRANAYYKKGMETLQTDSESTIKQWQEALNSYNASLELHPEAEDARFNHALVEKKLKELEKQEEQKKEQEKKDSDKEGQQDQSKKDSDQSNPEEKSGEQQKSEDGSDSRQNDQQPEEEKDAKEQKQEQSSPQPEEKETDEQQSQAAEEKNDSDKKNNAAINEERRSLGKMTKEEAEQLLDGLKNEEGNLNFIPVREGRSNDDPRRDW